MTTAVAKERKYGIFDIPGFIALVFTVLFSAAPALAEGTGSTIQADSLVYHAEEKKYELTGSVRVERGTAIIQSAKVIYHEESGDITAEGNVRYDDAEVFIIADRVEMNLESKTGKLFGALVFYKKENYYISGTVLERRGEDSYYSSEASVTPCDAPTPAWCFKGTDVDLLVGDRLTAKNVTFRVKDVPVLYSPYLWAPVTTERKTGLLFPAFSQSAKRGFGVKVPFYWAISEKRDATLVADAYTKRGVGLGMEYRWALPDDKLSTWWAYYIRDHELNTSYWELKVLHEQQRADRPGWFLNVNYVNEKDFYREYGTRLSNTARRYLESTGEFSYPFRNARAYLLAQYWVDLKHATGEVPQRLPEAGYVMNYRPLGPFLFGMSAAAMHHWREIGLSATKFDIYPRILHSAGRDFVLTQQLAARWTWYDLYRTEGVDETITRGAVEYLATLSTRLYRKYGGFTHVIEPSVHYHLIANSENNIPVFDDDELFRQTSIIGLTLLNRIVIAGVETATIRVMQEFDLRDHDRPAQPLHFDMSLKTPLPLRVAALYDHYTGKVEEVSSQVSWRYRNAVIGLGQRYNRREDVMLFTAALGLEPMSGLNITASASYDTKGAGLREMDLTLRYARQCWAIRFEAINRPDDFSFHVFFELAGINMQQPAYLINRDLFLRNQGYPVSLTDSVQ